MLFSIYKMFEHRLSRKVCYCRLNVWEKDRRWHKTIDRVIETASKSTNFFYLNDKSKKNRKTNQKS